MIVKKADEIKGGEITPKHLYLNRRSFIRGAVLAGSTLATGALYKKLTGHSQESRAGDKIEAVEAMPPSTGAGVLNEARTSYQDVTHYNNFYEFSTDKQAVAPKSRGFITRPWTVAVEGLVSKPGVYDLDDLLKISPPEERVYRHRCVEGWSMVIPWVGFPLARLLDRVQPTSQAAYVEFVTLVDPAQMPNVRTDLLEWPYVEGLRMDEALHPLTILASGLYGETLPPQNGAPLRLVVPWKYGFKGIKSIVKIRFVDSQPKTTWSQYAPKEYGFYSNVNPHVDHPRWSQARERRIGELGMRDTLMFNGYADQVAQLYTGMDLKVYY
jgi:sulfoxide reductase catalytic subunit YedY